MKRIFTISIIIASIFITSCEKKAEAIDTIGVPLIIGDISLSTTTKAIEKGNVLESGAQIGVQVINADGDALYDISSSSNIKYTLSSGSSWAPVTSFALELNVGKVYAYYPYDPNLVGMATDIEPDAFIDVILSDANDETQSADIDYMYYLPTDVLAANTLRQVSGKSDPVDDNKIELTLEHALSMVTFNFYLEGYYNDFAYLTKFEISDVSATSFIKTTNLKMNIATGAVMPKTSASDSRGMLTRVFTEDGYSIVGGTAAAPVATFSFLVCPFENSTGGAGKKAISVTFYIDGSTYLVYIPQNSSSTNSMTNTVWEAGKNNVYQIKVSSTGVGIGPLQVKAWSEADKDITEDIEIVPPVQ